MSVQLSDVALYSSLQCRLHGFIPIVGRVPLWRKMHEQLLLLL